MSPASKSKSRKLSTRAAKEQPKVSSKSSNLHANGGKSAPTSAYDPALGTFHTIEISTSAPSLVMQKNTQDESEENCIGSPGTTVDSDSGSTNDSCSGESEDHRGEKATSSTAPRSDSIPVPGSDAEKRDKIRQKNERKHRRQKEKRAQELHMRCSGYLMSKKLEALAEQLVAMGFSSDHATAALIANEGRMEECVAWLLQEGEENNEHVMPNSEDGGSCMKIDISDELAKIVALETMYRCSKQEVERAVVACDGDLDKAEDYLKSQKQEQTAFAGGPKVEDDGEHNLLKDKLGMTSGQDPMVGSQGTGGALHNQQQQWMDERGYTGRNLQSMKTQRMPDWVRAQVAAAAAIEKRWSDASSNPPISRPLGSAFQCPVPSATSDSRYVVFNGEVKMNMQSGSQGDPFVLHRPQSMINFKQSSSSPNLCVSASTGWYPNGISNAETLPSDVTVGHVSYSPGGLSGVSAPQAYPRSHVKSFVPHPPEFMSANSSVSSFASASSLAAPASLGLFSGWGPLRSSNSVGWSSVDSSSQRDYSSIDWSLDLAQLRLPVKVDGQLSDARSAMMMARNARERLVANGVYISGLHDSGSFVTGPSASSASQEWTTPFEGKDLFGIPRRQFVASPL